MFSIKNNFDATLAHTIIKMARFGFSAISVRNSEDVTDSVSVRYLPHAEVYETVYGHAPTPVVVFQSESTKRTIKVRFKMGKDRGNRTGGKITHVWASEEDKEVVSAL